MSLPTDPNCRRQAARERGRVAAAQALGGKMALLEAAEMMRRRGLLAKGAGNMFRSRRRPRRRGIDVDAVEARMADWRRRWNSARYVVVVVVRLRVAQNWSSD